MTQEDKVLPLTRIAAAILAPVLALAVVMLYIFAGDTDQHWAWTINPELTAMFMGAGYACGSYYFTRMVFSGSWRAVGLGLIPITGFTIFMFLATVVHWDRFDHGHVAFGTWTFLYIVTPIIVPALYLMNRHEDPGTEPGEVKVPISVRGVLGVAGIALAGLAIVMMVSPTSIIDDWLWQLSELTARVLAAFILLTGGLLFVVAFDGRWRASRVHIETFVLGTVLMSIAIIRDWDSLRDNDAVRWGYLASVILAGVLLTAFYLWMRQREAAEA